jgi:hypothetical protein
VQKWNGVHFKQVTLQELGLCIQLGHSPGVTCPNPEPCTANEFVIVDINHVHMVGLDFCACGSSDQTKTIVVVPLVPSNHSESKNCCHILNTRTLGVVGLHVKGFGV